jgi:hypothetical protein
VQKYTDGKKLHCGTPIDDADVTLIRSVESRTKPKIRVMWLHRRLINIMKRINCCVFVWSGFVLLCMTVTLTVMPLYSFSIHSYMTGRIVAKPSKEEETEEPQNNNVALLAAVGTAAEEDGNGHPRNNESNAATTLALHQPLVSDHMIPSSLDNNATVTVNSTTNNSSFLSSTADVSSSSSLMQFQQLGCLKHEPMTIQARDVVVNESITTLELKLRDGCGPLRRDWRNNPPLSQYAQMILQHQSNCSLPSMTWEMDNLYGLGSHITQWSQSMCYAWEHDVKLQSFRPIWLWLDKTYCPKPQARKSPWLCYFPKLEHVCKGKDVLALLQQPQQQQNQNQTILPAITSATTSKNTIMPNRKPCWHAQQQQQPSNNFVPAFRAASIEYMFRTVSPLVIREAQRQVGVVFGPNGAPNDLITVHVRWGDKNREMQLVTIDKYMDAIGTLIQERESYPRASQQPQQQQSHTDTIIIHPNETMANIYLATEDPLAARAFVQAAPIKWKIYMDVAIDELTLFRPYINRLNQPSQTAKNTRGRAGLINLASLLVGMEANDYVLTTASSFSRIINSLRTNIVDPRCNNCTRMMDLQPGMW